jgi:hypothetical protein
MSAEWPAERSLFHAMRFAFGNQKKLKLFITCRYTRKDRDAGFGARAKVNGDSVLAN